MAQSTILTTKYPTSLDTTSTLGEVSNRTLGVLSVDLTSGTETEISLSDASQFPNSGAVTIDNEIFHYVSKSGNVLTLENRGQQGTAAAAHLLSALVYLRMTKGHFEVLKTSLIATQTKLGISSSTPSASTWLKGTGAGTSAWSAIAKADVGLSAVENTALTTWTGSSTVVTVGTIGTGTWNATVIADGKIASALTGKTYNGLTLTTTTGVFTLASGKTFTVNNTLIFSGTDSTTMTFPSTSASVARTDAAQTFTGAQTFSSTIVGSINGNSATVTTNANLTGNVTSSGNATTIASGVVTLGMMASLAANSIIGNNTGVGATPIALSTSQVKTLLSLNLVENTALSTWAGSANITTLGTISTGTWSGSTIAVNKGGTGGTAASITLFNNITGYSAAGSTGTTTTNLVFSTSPVLTTPNIGSATASLLTVASNSQGLVLGSSGSLSIYNDDSDAGGSQWYASSSKGYNAWRLTSTATTVRILAYSGAGSGYFQVGITGGSNAGSWFFSGINGATATSVQFLATDSWAAGNFGIGHTGTNSAKAHIISTTEQLRVGYDTSNYYKTTVGSTGGVTFDAVGSGSLFTFADPVVSRRKLRTYTTASTATLTPEIDTYDLFHLTAMAVNLTIANHSTSTPNDGDQIKIRMLDNGSVRTITHGTNYVAKNGVALLATTTVSKNCYELFEWNTTLGKYNLLASGMEA